jgi:hypothetical protein
VLSQSSEFYPRALDNPLKLGQEFGVHRVVARLEGFYRLLAAGDQNRQQRCLLCVRSVLDVRTLPRYAAAKTHDPRSSERLREPRDHHEVGVLLMLAGVVLRYRLRYLPERISAHLTAPEGA